MGADGMAMARMASQREGEAVTYKHLTAIGKFLRDKAMETLMSNPKVKTRLHPVKRKRVKAVEVSDIGKASILLTRDSETTIKISLVDSRGNKLRDVANLFLREFPVGNTLTVGEIKNCFWIEIS
jgi:hypothetical protein